MDTAALIAASVAALAAIAGLVQHRRSERRRRLTEIADLVDEIRAAAEWGPETMLRRQEMQRKLASRASGLNLPKTAELAKAELRSSPESVALAKEALGEVKAELGT
jgi:hypothetical protein